MMVTIEIVWKILVHWEMEKSFTAVQKVDLVLRFLGNRVEAKPHITDGDLFSALRKLYPVLERQNDFGSDLLRILNKLIKEGYVDFEDTEPLAARRYFITFDGKLLSEEGGYEKALVAKDARRRWEEDLLQKGEENGERLNRLTLILGVGTIALAVVEVVKFVYELCCPGH